MNYSVFYETHFEGLVQFARFYLHNDDAMDVVQDVMASLWEKRDAAIFVDDLKSYVFSSVKHRCLDILKHETYKHEYCRRTLMSLRANLEMEMQTNQSPVIKYVEYKETEQVVRHAIEGLPKRCREVFLLSRFEGLHYKDIAEQLGISQNTVECQMTIALKKLRAKLKVS